MAENSGADLEVVEHFALIHDVTRENENEDMYYGTRSANLSQALSGDWIHLDRWQLNQLYEACQYHSMGRLTHDVTIQTCWDADRLDLGRVGTRPKSYILGNKDSARPRFS